MKPVAWPLLELRNCCEIVSGSTPSRERPEFWGGDIPWITPKDLSRLNGTPFVEGSQYITELGYRSCSTRLVPPGTVLFSSRAPIGLVGIAARALCTNQGFKNLIPRAGVVTTRYLYHCMRWMAPYLAELGNGATFKELSKEAIARVKIPVPPMLQQERLATILDLGSELCRKSNSGAEIIRKFRRNAFLDLVGDPLTNPKGWPTSSIGEQLQSIQYGPRFYNQQYSEDGVRIARITDVLESGDLDFSTMPKMSVSDDGSLENFLLKPGDLIVARSGATVGKVAMIYDGDPACIAGAYFIRLTFRERVKPVLARMTLESESIQMVIREGSRQSAQQNFSGPGLKRLPLPVPPLDLQRRLEEIEVAARNLSTRERKRVNVSDELFKGLVQKAFRGEL